MTSHTDPAVRDALLAGKAERGERWAVVGYQREPKPNPPTHGRKSPYQDPSRQDLAAEREAAESARRCDNPVVTLQLGYDAAILIADALDIISPEDDEAEAAARGLAVLIRQEAEDMRC